jgi:outer membrane protein assembly factor BamB
MKLKAQKTKAAFFFVFAFLFFILAGCKPSLENKVPENVYGNEYIDQNEPDYVNEDIDNSDIEEKEPPGPALALPPAEGCSPSEYGFSPEISLDDSIISEFKPQTNIFFPRAEDYSQIQGITTFRGNNHRDTASYGFVSVSEEKLEKVWSSNTGYINTWTIIGANGEPSLVPWTGVGWNGQAAIVKWDPDVQDLMNIYPEKKDKPDLKEVICSALDGKIYFLDLEDGQPTRPPIDMGFPIKGSVTIDPRGYPLLYVGQGLDENDHKKGAIGYRIYSLIEQKEIFMLNGIDPFALRYWGAFDSVGLVDGETDTLIVFGENGILYNIKLNTDFNKASGTVSISPEIIRYRYRSPFGRKIGSESSPAIYRNYVFFPDNGGVMQCVDLNTMKPVWVRDITDDSDSTPVIEEKSESEVYLYTACEVDLQGHGGYSYMRKLNALTGELLWEKAVKCSYDWYNNGGTLATPVLGKHDIDNLVIFNVSRTGDNNNGTKLLALDRETGSEVWSLNLDYYSWSSPVDVYTESGKSYLVFFDSGGFMYLIEGKSGKILDRISVEANVEASPVVYDNMVVIGTRGQVIYGINIK